MGFTGTPQTITSILRSTPDVEPDRLNASIALQMRKEGFSREAVLETILLYAQEGQPPQPERDWQRYAERATASAFGIAGDMVLARGAAEREKAKQEQEKQEEEARQESPRMRMR